MHPSCHLTIILPSALSLHARSGADVLPNPARTAPTTHLHPSSLSHPRRHCLGSGHQQASAEVAVATSGHALPGRLSPRGHRSPAHGTADRGHIYLAPVPAALADLGAAPPRPALGHTVAVWVAATGNRRLTQASSLPGLSPRLTRQQGAGGTVGRGGGARGHPERRGPPSPSPGIPRPGAGVQDEAWGPTEEPEESSPPVTGTTPPSQRPPLELGLRRREHLQDPMPMHLPGLLQLLGPPPSLTLPTGSSGSPHGRPCSDPRTSCSFGVPRTGVGRGKPAPSGSAGPGLLAPPRRVSPAPRPSDTMTPL